MYPNGPYPLLVSLPTLNYVDQIHDLRGKVYLVDTPVDNRAQSTTIVTASTCWTSAPLGGISAVPYRFSSTSAPLADHQSAVPEQFRSTSAPR